MPIHLLSTRQIAGAGDGQLADGEGLTLRIASDQGRWWFRYTAPGGQRRAMSLGAAIVRGDAKLIDQSVRQAREIAAEARGLLARGHDPLEQRNAGKDQARKRVEDSKSIRKRDKTTLARVARAYHEAVIEQSRTALHAHHWITSLENHLPASIWHAPIDSITPPALLDVMLAIQRKVPETARRIRQRLEAVFNDAQLRGQCQGNPALTIRRSMTEALGKRHQKSLAALPFAEVPVFVKALRQQKGVAAKALEFAMLTAARTAEVLGAQWAEFDLDAALWVVPGHRMKAREEHAVFLSQRAVEILRERRGEPQPFKLSNLAMLMLLRRMRIADRTTVHGLCRASFSTWANETNAGRPDVIEACLAHQEQDRIRARYNKAKFAAERKALLAEWADFCDGRKVAVANAVNVVPLPIAA